MAAPAFTTRSSSRPFGSVEVSEWWEAEGGEELVAWLPPLRWSDLQAGDGSGGKGSEGKAGSGGTGGGKGSEGKAGSGGTGTGEGSEGLLGKAGGGGGKGDLKGGRGKAKALHKAPPPISRRRAREIRSVRANRERYMKTEKDRFVNLWKYHMAKARDLFPAPPTSSGEDSRFTFTDL